jgi:hypothetical protein
VVYALSFLEVKSLLQQESVNKTWWILCKTTTHGKCGPNGPKAFQSNKELGDAVINYCEYEAKAMEEISCTYGYPIDKWNVSQVKDMSCMFENLYTFNKTIGSWGVSSVTDMSYMFFLQLFSRILGSIKCHKCVIHVCRCSYFQPRHWLLECIQCS